MTNPSRRQRGFGIVGALDQEWRELVGMHPEAVMGWAVRHAVLAPYHSLDDVLSAARQPSDAVLAALLAEVSAGDRLAGRVVLQALVGRIARMAQRDPRSGIDDYLGALWQVINNYPLARRPVRIAANLSMDALQAVARERSWAGQKRAQVVHFHRIAGGTSRAGRPGWTTDRLSSARRAGSTSGSRGEQSVVLDR